MALRRTKYEERRTKNEGGGRRARFALRAPEPFGRSGVWEGTPRARRRCLPRLLRLERLEGRLSADEGLESGSTKLETPRRRKRQTRPPRRDPQEPGRRRPQARG